MLDIVKRLGRGLIRLVGYLLLGVLAMVIVSLIGMFINAYTVHVYWTLLGLSIILSCYWLGRRNFNELN